MSDVIKYVLGLGLGVVALSIILAILWVAFLPEKVEKIAGWVVFAVSYVVRRLRKKAIALDVQGEVNGLRARFEKNAPVNLITKKLKIRFTTAEEAEARLRDGDVLVFMKDSRRKEENIANAIMAYLPKALIPRARRYVETDTMRSIDLTVAKALLSHEDGLEGALDVFYDRHLDPARGDSDRIKQKISEIDSVDLHGWLSRILLAEYRRLGDRLHPGEPDQECLEEAEKLAEWLADLAARPPGNTDGSLTFDGRHFRVAIVFVAARNVLEEKGTDPYRKRAKRHVYGGKYDSIYLIARDRNIPAVDELVESLGEDAMIATSTRYVFRLRPDFKERVLNRERAICVCLRRRQSGEDPDEVSDEDVALPQESYDPHTSEPAAPASPVGSSESGIQS
jgi:hypothetical protein